MSKKNDWLEYIEKHENSPDKVFQMAKSEWQKLVAIEFFRCRQEIDMIKQKQDFHEKILYSIFGVTVLAFITQFLIQVLPKLLEMI